ncbi:MAG: D-glucuronyl C5-epimerase family protein, partial [bacterium]
MKSESLKTPQSELKKPRLSLVYPFNWQGLENFVYPLDAKGIPQVPAGKHLGLRYNHVTIAQYGLYHLQKYAQNREEGVLQIVRTIVDWLVDNIQPRQHEIGAWLFDYDLEFYGPRAPWLSGMAQGQGISLLLRAHQIIEKACLLEISQQAFRAFLYPVAEGGVVAHFPDGSLVFEEFPTRPASLVLNGHIFALLGIYDYSVFWQDKSAHELFELACIGLKKNL